MHANEWLREGKLDAALAALQDDVRRAPGDAKLRVFLFQLLAVLGQWERALKQLQTAATLDAAAVPMAHTYRELIGCELFRSEVFAGQRQPSVLGEPTAWVALALRALALTGSDPKQAEALRSEAFELAPANPGHVDGTPFAWLGDADTRLGPLLEVVVHGRYYLLPFERLASLKCEPPADLRDFVWCPTQLTLTSGQELIAFVPTRYPGAEHAADDAIKLARKTDWQTVGEGTFVGFGQRMFATDAGELALLDVRHVQFGPVESHA